MYLRVYDDEYVKPFSFLETPGLVLISFLFIVVHAILCLLSSPPCAILMATMIGRCDSSGCLCTFVRYV
jgi:hypothetical protein